jgi:hypothetical protein
MATATPPTTQSTVSVTTNRLSAKASVAPSPLRPGDPSAEKPLGEGLVAPRRTTSSPGHRTTSIRRGTRGGTGLVHSLPLAVIPASPRYRG